MDYGLGIGAVLTGSKPPPHGPCAGQGSSQYVPFAPSDIHPLTTPAMPVVEKWYSTSQYTIPSAQTGPPVIVINSPGFTSVTFSPFIPGVNRTRTDNGGIGLT
jgi:hypothetical protein